MILKSDFKDYVNDDDQFVIHQDKFLNLVDLVYINIWYLFDSEFSQRADGVKIGGTASSTKAEIYIQALEQSGMSTALYPLKGTRRILTNKYTTALTTKQAVRRVLLAPC